MIEIRRATVVDAEAIAAIINGVIDEGGRTSLRKFSQEEERDFIASMDEREVMFVALDGTKVVGFQGLSKFARWSDSMDHVGNVLTMVRPEYRGLGIGTAMAERTFAFAREHGYEKISTYIIADNASAMKYYEGLGFSKVGLWRDQVILDDGYHDDVIVEKFL
jgi:RimJ/RimL family protein N-acetyltransferase